MGILKTALMLLVMDRMMSPQLQVLQSVRLPVSVSYLLVLLWHWGQALSFLLMLALLWQLLLLWLWPGCQKRLLAMLSAVPWDLV